MNDTRMIYSHSNLNSPIYSSTCPWGKWTTCAFSDVVKPLQLFKISKKSYSCIWENQKNVDLIRTRGRCPFRRNWRVVNVIYSQMSWKYSVYSSLPLSPATPVLSPYSGKVNVWCNLWCCKTVAVIWNLQKSVDLIRERWTYSAFSDVVKLFLLFEIPGNRIRIYDNR